MLPSSWPGQHGHSIEPNLSTPWGSLQDSDQSDSLRDPPNGDSRPAKPIARRSAWREPGVNWIRVPGSGDGRGGRMMDTAWEQKVRERAHTIWERAGRP